MGLKIDFRKPSKDYLETRGWATHPLVNNEQHKPKRPITYEWSRLTADDVSGLDWKPARGIGLLTGPVSGNIGGIDVDDEALAIAVLDCIAHWPNPPLAQHTITGRCHVFVIETEPTVSCSFRVWWRGAWRSVQFIGVSSEGAAGNIAIAPTPGYSWVHPQAEPAYSTLTSVWDKIMAGIGATWFPPEEEITSTRQTYSYHQPGAEGYGSAGYPRPFQDFVSHGDRNNAQFVEAARLFEQGADFAGVVQVLQRRYVENYEKHPSDSRRGEQSMRSTIRSAAKRVERERQRKQRLDEHHQRQRDELREQLAELHAEQAAAIGFPFQRIAYTRLLRKRSELVAQLRRSDDPEIRSLAEEIAACRVRFQGYRYMDAGQGDHGTQFIRWSCCTPGCPCCSIGRLHRAWDQKALVHFAGGYLLARLRTFDGISGPGARKQVDQRASRWRGSRASAKDSILTTLIGVDLTPYVAIAVPQPKDREAVEALKSDWERDWSVEIVWQRTTPDQVLEFWLAEHERELMTCKVEDFDTFVEEIKGRKRFRGAGHFRRHATLEERIEEDREGAEPMDQSFVTNNVEEEGVKERLHPLRGFSGSNPRRESPPCAVCGERHGKRLPGTVSIDELEIRDGTWQRRVQEKPVGWATPLKRRGNSGRRTSA